MRIIIDTTHYYEWVPVPEGVEVTDKDIADKVVKRGHHDEWLMRITLPADGGTTHHDIAIPESQFDAYKTPNRENTHKMSRPQVVARHLTNAVLPNLGEQEHITGITVEDDPESEPEKVQAFLRVYFGVPAAPDGGVQ